jgi:Fur family ferric uptake transcriptional regulator
MDETSVHGRLRAGGRRMTSQRRAILRIIDGCDGHIAADDLCRQLQAEYPDINRSTVYRTLQTLEELGLVRHAHDETGARAYHRSTEAGHVHLVCRRCGGHEQVDGAAVDDLFAGLRQRFGFEPDPTHFPVFGVCRACGGGSA